MMGTKENAALDRLVLVERAFNEVSPGVEVWVGVLRAPGWRLGYGRIPITKRWGLMLRERGLTPTPVLLAPVEVYEAASEVLPDLVDEVIRHVQEVTRRVEKALRAVRGR